MNTTPALRHPADNMRVRSELLGELNVDSTAAFHFPAGLLGFPDSHDFVLLPAEISGLYWLQSTEHSALTFLLVDPFPYFPGYSVELGLHDLRELGNPEKDNLLVLAIVTLPRSNDQLPTANLQGPIALDLIGRNARQVAISESGYGVRETFALPRD